MVRVKRYVALLAAGMLTAAPTAAPESRPEPVASEHVVKAAMLYRIAKFIEWPANSFAAADAPFLVCVVDDEAAVRAFYTITGRTLNGHDVQVRRITGDMLDLRHCHAVFFPDDADADIDYALAKLRGLPVLTVGEAEDFAQRGGMLALFTRDARVTFAINVGASKEARLSVSAQLLQLAKVVSSTP